MSAGLWLLLGLLAGFALIAIAQAAMSRASRASEGKPAPDLGALGSAEGKLVWFHAPGCAPCRAMSPAIRALGDQVVSIDVQQRPEIAAGFGVMATPTTVRVSGGQIAAVRLGRLSQAELSAMLAG